MMILEIRQRRADTENSPDRTERKSASQLREEIGKCDMRLKERHSR